MSKITQFLDDVFKHFDVTEEIEKERKRLNIFVEKKYNDYITLGLTEKEAFEKVKEDFGQKQGLIKKIEKKLGVTHFEDINLKETGAKKATTADTLLVNINDARNLIKQRLIINIGVFITYLLVGFGLCGFAYLTFVQDIPVMAFNLTFEPWVAGLIVLGITLVFGILFFTLAGLNLYKAHDSIRIEKH